VLAKQVAMPRPHTVGFYAIPPIVIVSDILSDHFAANSILLHHA
jgi:hypothetical protein